MGVNRLATKGEKYYWLPTQRVKSYRLPKKADIIFLFSERRAYCIFFFYLSKKEAKIPPTL